MNLFGTAAAGALALVTVPALAQTLQPATSGPHPSCHACLAARLADRHQAMAEHMAHFQATHPTARRWEVRLERHSFSEQDRTAHQPEIDAARAACGYRHRPIG